MNLLGQIPFINEMGVYGKSCLLLQPSCLSSWNI